MSRTSRPSCRPTPPSGCPRTWSRRRRSSWTRSLQRRGQGRRALAARPLRRSRGGRPGLARRDDVEAHVGRIWSGVLGLDEHRIDPFTDFHQLGGDSVSLLAMLAGVCRDVVPARRETDFMAQLNRVIAAPTVTTVAAIAREVALLDTVG
ncbi:acyl carrier protein [Catenulispora yoronensis]